MIFEFLKIGIPASLYFIASLIGGYYFLDFLKDDPYVFLLFIIYSQVMAIGFIYFLWKRIKTVFFGPILNLWDLVSEIVYNNQFSRRVENIGNYEMGTFLHLFNKLLAQHQNMFIDKSLMEETIEELENNTNLEE